MSARKVEWCHGLPAVWVVFGWGIHNGRLFGTARSCCRICASMRADPIRAPREVSR